MEAELVVGILILVALVFVATIDMAFSLLSDVALMRLATESEELNTPKAAFLREILTNRPRFLFALSSTIQFLLISFTVLVTMAVLEFTQIHAWIVVDALLICVTATVVFRQLLPRLIVRNEPEGWFLLLLPGVRPIYIVTSLIARPFDLLFRRKNELADTDATAPPEALEERFDDTADDLQALMEVGEAEGIIEEKDRELIESMVEFSDTRAGEIMTPRTEIVALSIDSTIQDARDLIIEEKYSRLPVYNEKIDNIEGVIYVRDLLQAWATGSEDQPIRGLLRHAYFVPETKTAAELLKAMQTEHVQIAIVIDEYGGVAGIVTVEDIVEEIVGEIEDEDIVEEEIIEIIEGEGGYYDVLGSTEVDKIERLLGVELEDEEYNTVAGMITSEAGYVPKKGAKLKIRGLDIEVLKADQKRIHLVRLCCPEAEDTPAAAGN
ncbi:MAG TPA: hemolysin family protein [Pyrinomonadaceae bacterium]|nr:hemolysin family protein [Pyrinomonadaceae bacterium]HMP66871.1 hemolysin family protein [Pyrinomonadaceae bacterium]